MWLLTANTVGFSGYCVCTPLVDCNPRLLSGLAHLFVMAYLITYSKFRSSLFENKGRWVDSKEGVNASTIDFEQVVHCLPDGVFFY